MQFRDSLVQPVFANKQGSIRRSRVILKSSASEYSYVIMKSRLSRASHVRRKKRKNGSYCNNANCESRTLIDMSTTRMPEKNLTGLYAIKKNNKVIYVGKSQGYMRKRLRAHIGGYDDQRIGDYMKRKKNRKNISFSWIKTRRPDKKEHSVIKCVGHLQGEHPKFNIKRGDRR